MFVLVTDFACMISRYSHKILYNNSAHRSTNESKWYSTIVSVNHILFSNVRTRQTKPGLPNEVESVKVTYNSSTINLLFFLHKGVLKVFPLFNAPRVTAVTKLLNYFIQGVPENPPPECSTFENNNYWLMVSVQNYMWQNIVLWLQPTIY